MERMAVWIFLVFATGEKVVQALEEVSVQKWCAPPHTLFPGKSNAA